MKTTVQRRLARVAGLSVLLMIAFTTSIQVAQAAVVDGSGAGSGAASSAPTHRQQGLTAANAARHDQGAAVATVASATPAGTQGKGGVSLATTGSSSASGASSASTGSSASASTQGLTPAQRHHFIGPPQSVVAVSAAAGTQGRGGVALAQSTPAGGQASTTASRHIIGHFQPTTTVLANQTGSSSATSTSAWIAAGSAAAIFLIGLAAWSLTRRRGQSGGRPSAAYCAQHPDDALCSAG